MKIYLYLLIFVVLAMGMACTTSNELEDPGGLREKLENLDGVSVVELVPYYDFGREFLLNVEQPLDHGDSSSGTFTQTVYILHRSESAPVVLGCSGYAAFSDDLHEMTVALDANQVSVSHRYFANSTPADEGYEYLNETQAAADLHRVVELLKEVYSGDWLSSGFGKGGLTALSHRRYYPDDVKATICYSTPFMNGQNDSRPVKYIQTLGADSTREKIKMFREALLKRRSEIYPYIYNFMNYTASYYYYNWSFGADLILELAVLNYPFEYWASRNQDISAVPDSSESADILFSHLTDAVWLEYYSNNYNDYLEPAYYQGMTELGAQAFDTDGLQDLFTSVDVGSGNNPYYEALLSDDLQVNYSSLMMDDLTNWLVSDGNNIIYLYGEMDPMSAVSIDLSGTATNAIKLVQSGLDRYVNTGDLDDAGLVYNALSDWMGFQIEPLSKGICTDIVNHLKVPLQE